MAEALLRGALRLRPEHAPALFVRAQIEYLRGEYRRAIATALEVRRIDPTHTLSLKVLGLANIQIGAVDLGRELLRQYLRAHPNAPDAADLARHL